MWLRRPLPTSNDDVVSVGVSVGHLYGWRYIHAPDGVLRVAFVGTVGFLEIFPCGSIFSTIPRADLRANPLSFAAFWAYHFCADVLHTNLPFATDPLMIYGRVNPSIFSDAHDRRRRQIRFIFHGPESPYLANYHDETPRNDSNYFCGRPAITDQMRRRFEQSFPRIDGNQPPAGTEFARSVAESGA